MDFTTAEKTSEVIGDNSPPHETLLAVAKLSDVETSPPLGVLTSPFEVKTRRFETSLAAAVSLMLPIRAFPL